MLVLDVLVVISVVLLGLSVFGKVGEGRKLLKFWILLEVSVKVVSVGQSLVTTLSSDKRGLGFC